MNTEQIRSFVMRYLEAEQCDILEKHPAYVTVKLSPSADRDLTNRPYYWSFVERTGAAPETMTCTFIFDPEAYRELHPPQAAGTQTGISAAAPPGLASIQGTGAPVMGQQAPAAPGMPPQAPGTPPQGDSILGRYFGFVPTSFTARIPRDEVTYGSRRLEQMFESVRTKGRFVRMFEHYAPDQPRNAATVPYDTWLAVNYKIEYACDLKRSELLSLGIRLQTGEIRDRFHELLLAKKLTPRLPAHVYVTPDRITLPRAVLFLEEHLERKVAASDHRWAQEAQYRLSDELARMADYYESLLKSAEPEQRIDIETQYGNRRNEIERQYRPRVQVSVINCGLFHLPPANGPSS
ncbi:hypothetical protein O9H85_18430 [Paenibacillus filicis]|uniref:Uncharacterized protein n=2 Tax=Paenibacillus gyeongsangnamensis TaxID=3388067 RepID=A0ABT4QC10_9BACL|nr:YqhG family protein [Paenibacillus filicis]MCZ8514364.1 hypothetical protein [Paenibacillus filicis]